MATTDYLLLTTYYLLHTTYYFTTYYILLTTYYFTTERRRLREMTEAGGRGRGTLSTLESLAVGVTSALIGGICTQPIDVVRSKCSHSKYSHSNYGRSTWYVVSAAIVSAAIVSTAIVSTADRRGQDTHDAQP